MHNVQRIIQKHNVQRIIQKHNHRLDRVEIICNCGCQEECLLKEYCLT